MKIAKFIDYTLLKATGTRADIERMCREAKEYGFKALCVHPYFVNVCREQLKDSEVEIATVVGFPFGANKSQVKAFEAAQAVEDGATEIDMVINIAEMLRGDISFVAQDIAAVVKAVEGRALVKVIIETAYLSREQIVVVSKIIKESAACYVKTSTGYAPSGAKVEDIQLIRETVGPDFGIKASGGISDYQTAVKMIEAGATRLGASKGIEIVSGA